jgi:hypothetical protein
MSRERQSEIKNLEYRIRKLERGIKVAHRHSLILNGDTVDYDFMIKQRVKEIKTLRDRLEKLTGRRSPNTPKWPV